MAQEYNYNVGSIADLSESNLRLLSKEGRNCRFEYGGDYWSYENGILIQYSSYDDLFNRGQSGKVVFAPKEGLVSDYGAVLTDQIWNNEKLDKFANFSLKDKHDFISSKNEDGGKKIIPLQIDKKLSENLDKQTRSNKEKINNAPVINAKELEPVKAIAQALLDTLTVSFAFMKSLKVRRSHPESYIRDILMKMEHNEINPNKLAHRAMLEKDPTIKALLDKYEHFSLDLKRQNMPNEKIVENVVKKALEDNTFMDKAENLANSDLIEKQFSKQVMAIKSFFGKTKNCMEGVAGGEDIKNAIENFSPEQKESFIQKIKEVDIFKVFKSQDLDPENFNNRMEVFLSNAFLIGIANEEELNYKHIMTKHVGIADDSLYKDLSFARVADIAIEISKDIFNALNINQNVAQTQKEESGMKMKL